MLSSRYQDEMQKLRSLVDEFVRKHPGLAPMFGAPGVDPEMERFLEGSAFLSALLSERLQDDWPEILHPLIQRVQPRWLRPTPSATILSFTPKSSLNHPITIPKGARVSSLPVEGTACHFRTCSDVAVHPIALLDAAFDHLPGQRPAIRLTFALNGISLSDWDVTSLRLLPGGSFANAADIHLLLARHLEYVKLLPLEGGALCSLSPDKLIPVADTHSDPLFDGVPSAFPGLGALLDYFTCPEKFLFLDLAGLDGWRERGRGSRFELSFILKNELPLPPPVIDAASFILAATPAVNLFKGVAEPMPLSDSRIYRIVPSGREKHASVWSVDDVTGLLKSGTARKRRYRPSSLMGNLFDEPCYGTLVKLRPLPPGFDLFLELDRPQPVEETITASITCTNGALPARLGVGGVSVRTADIAEGVEVRNVSAVTPAADPPLEPNRLWKLSAFTKPQFGLLSDAEGVRSALGTLAASVRGDREGLSAALARIGGIEDVSVQAKDIMRRGTVWRGIKAKTKLNREAYASIGELYLFAWAFEKLIGGFVTENFLVRLTVEESAGRFRYAWDSRAGEQPLV